MEAKKRKLIQQGALEDTIDSFELVFEKQIRSVQSDFCKLSIELSRLKSELLAAEKSKNQAELKLLKREQGNYNFSFTHLLVSVLFQFMSRATNSVARAVLESIMAIEIQKHQSHQVDQCIWSSNSISQAVAHWPDCPNNRPYDFITTLWSRSKKMVACADAYDVERAFKQLYSVVSSIKHNPRLQDFVGVPLPRVLNDHFRLAFATVLSRYEIPFVELEEDLVDAQGDLMLSCRHILLISCC